VAGVGNVFHRKREAATDWEPGDEMEQFKTPRAANAPVTSELLGAPPVSCPEGARRREPGRAGVVLLGACAPASEQAPFFVRAVPAIPSCASCVTMLPSAETSRDSQATRSPDGRVISGDQSSPLNKDFYANLKGQGWWTLRRRFECTYRAIAEGKKYKPEELISLPSDLPMLRQLEKELLQPVSKLTSNMRLMVDKQPEGMRSPNMADAVMMAYHPVKSRATRWSSSRRIASSWTGATTRSSLRSGTIRSGRNSLVPRGAMVGRD
jgi:hypothetical protein